MTYLEMLLLGIIVFFPLLDLINEKFKSTSKNIENIKIAAFFWLPTSLLAYLFLGQELSVTSLGMEVQHNWQNILVAALLLLAVIYLLLLVRSIRASEALREEISAKFEAYKEILPVTKNEMLVFTLVLSVSAGICEELLFRAYLYTFLDNHIGMLAAVILSSLMFGIWHIYLGWQEVIKTSIVGAVLCGIYIFTGSILLPILVHIFIDVYSGLLCYFAMQKPQAEATSS